MPGPTQRPVCVVPITVCSDSLLFNGCVIFRRGICHSACTFFSVVLDVWIASNFLLLSIRPWKHSHLHLFIHRSGLGEAKGNVCA